MANGNSAGLMVCCHSLTVYALSSAFAASEVCFEVMDYMPGILYGPMLQYWDVIDGAIRAIQFKYIPPVVVSLLFSHFACTCYLSRSQTTKFRILIGYWQYSIPTMWEYLASLNTLQNVEVRYFVIPRKSLSLIGKCSHKH